MGTSDEILVDEEEQEILRSEVEHAKHRLSTSTDKVPGHDDVSSELFKEADEEGVSIFHDKL